VEAWRGLDTMQTAGRVKNAYDEAATDDKPTMIVVDVIGVGAGVVDRLRELGLPVRALNVAEAPAVRAKFHRLRDEMYWRGREWFEGLNVECTDTQVGAELGDVTYGYTSSGQIKVEPKDAIKERLGRSPDVGESLLLSLMEDCQAIPDERSDRYRRARARTAETAWAA
jgi:phage terminase large subunit